MREPLVIAVAQPRCVAFDVAANAVAHADAIDTAAARIVVFPELSLTGYELDAPAITPTDPRLAPIVEACARSGSVALVGAPVEGPAGPHIATLAIDGTGATIAYRKINVGPDESHRFAAGDGPRRLTVDGWRLGLAICRDTGFVQHRAETAALGIDAYVAGTVMAPDERDTQDERARMIAAEYGLPVAVASFAGATGGGYNETAGHSGIWDGHGALLGQSGAQAGEVVSAVWR